MINKKNPENTYLRYNFRPKSGRAVGLSSGSHISQTIKVNYHSCAYRTELPRLLPKVTLVGSNGKTNIPCSSLGPGVIAQVGVPVSG